MGAAAIRKGERRLTDHLESKFLLIVAGPSGSGKTVFINQFRSGTLAPELRRLLPEGAERWPQIGANDCMKRSLPLAKVLPKPWTSPGGVVHYDTAFIHRFGLAGYHDDPSADLFRRAAGAVVVSISPSADQLKIQFAAREAQRRGSKKRSHLFWKDNIRRPIERLLYRLKGQNPSATGDLYDDPAWLSRCTEAWAHFATGIFGAKSGSRLITLEPYLDAEKGPSFRIVSPRP